MDNVPPSSEIRSRPRTEAGSSEPGAFCVVGSGPAGVACAKALLAQGKRVRMIDAGICLEGARAELIAQLRRSSPAAWSADQMSILKEGTSATAKGIPLKLIYGSDFPYREVAQHCPADYDAVELRPSLARGGLSNVWGAAMLPYTAEDIRGWPIQLSDLAEHYRAVLKITGLSARHDGLEKLFPLYHEQPPALNLSRQSGLLLARLEKNQARLARAGIHFGQARLAVRVSETERGSGCVYCGLCMYGCPYGCIYNSADTVAELQKDPKFSYQPDVIVTRLSETATSALVEGYDRSSRSPMKPEAQRVFLAAGVLPTTQILLRSMSVYDQSVSIKDSQYFLLPLVLTRSGGAVREEALHTLSQIFIEILDPAISPYVVHLQIYSYNDLVGQAIGHKLGPLGGRFRSLTRALESRLMIVQGYLHSDHSPAINAVLRKGADQPDRLQLKALSNPQTRPIIGRVMRKLLRQATRLGALPLPPLLQVAQAGRGFHSGGSFPMRSQPGPLESDVLGRPSGWQRVHAVDASVLPSIPATTITLSAMANAHRIGWEAARLS